MTRASVEGGVVALVMVGGEVDLTTVGDLDRTLRRAEADARLVVLDLRTVSFLDRAAGHAVMEADRRVRSAGGRLIVLRGPAPVDRLFRLLDAQRRLELVDMSSSRSSAPFEDVAA